MLASIDVETYLITDTDKFPELVTFQYAVDGESEVIFVHKPGVRKYAIEQLRILLTAKGMTLVFYNIYFDYNVLIRAFPELKAEFRNKLDETYGVLDLFVNERLRGIKLGENRFPGLDTVAKRELGITVDKNPAIRLRFGEVADRLKADPGAAIEREFIEYAKKDAEITYQLAMKIDLENDVYEQTKNAIALGGLARSGIRTDPKRVELIGRTLERRLTRRKKALQARNIIRKDGTVDTKEVKKRIVKELGNNAPKTEKGAVKKDAETIKLTADRVLRSYSRYQDDSKLFGTFLPTLRKGTSCRIQPDYNVLVTTGRTSCAKPNLQQIPRDGAIRRCFVPELGNVFIGADYDTAELRALAQVHLWMFGRSTFADVLNSETENDPHLALAAKDVGISYSEALARKEAGDYLILKRRKFAKTRNFGLAGGMGYKTFRMHAAKEGIALSQEESQYEVNNWYSTWKEMIYYKERCKVMAGKGETFVSQRPFNNKTLTQHMNTYFQSLTGDGSKFAARNVFLSCLSGELEGAKPVLFVHDEIWIECPEPLAEAYRPIFETILIDSMREFIPDVKIKATAVITDCWEKG